MSLAAINLLIPLCLILSAHMLSAQPVMAATHTEYDQRMAWFRDARFGMFIHFGLYAVPAGTWDEEPMSFAEYFGFNVDRARWHSLIDAFNPEKFDADKIARAAKDAGMKYLVITAKHHDGFCLYDSAHTEFDVMSTPLKRDLIGELSAACRKIGLRFGVYYSIIDLHHPDYLPRHEGDPKPEEKEDFERYIKFMKNQLRELLTNYGPLDVLWFDGEWESTWTHERAKDLWQFVREIDSDVLITNRIDKGRNGMGGMNQGDHFLGDYGTPEQLLLDANPGEDWETCQTMIPHGNWGHRHDENNYFSATELIHQAITTASLGGNLLLNIGPKADGSIPEPEQQLLAEIGQWMRSQGQTISGSQASPFNRRPAWGRTTRKGSVLYCHVMDWPADCKLKMPPMKSKPLEAKPLLAPDGEALPMAVDPSGAIEIDLGSVRQNRHATVIAVRFDQTPTAPPFYVRADEQGRYHLNAVDASINGGSARYVAENESIGYWTDSDTTIHWPIEIEPGRYEVKATYGVAKGEGGNYAVSIGDQTIEAMSQPTGGWLERETHVIGEVTVDKANHGIVKVSILEKPGTAVFDFTSLVLTPKK